MGFRKAERRKAKLRLGICGPAGSGKTASALLIAYGITGDWEKVGVVDTESGSGELYVNAAIGEAQIGEYNVLPLTAPYTPEKYTQAIKLAEQDGLEVVILDSLSHAWAGEGGLLDQQGKLADRSGNTWTAWRSITPKHNALVETMLSSKIHVIATMRSKMEHVQEKDSNGKTIIRKVGMAPIQREGMDYEMTVVFDLSIEHIASCSKDRTSLFDGQFFKPAAEHGQLLLTWLETGAEPLCTNEQRMHIVTEMQRTGIAADDVKVFTVKEFRKDKSIDLTISEVDKLLAHLSTFEDKGAEQSA